MTFASDVLGNYLFINEKSEKKNGMVHPLEVRVGRREDGTSLEDTMPIMFNAAFAENGAQLKCLKKVEFSGFSL